MTLYERLQPGDPLFSPLPAESPRDSGALTWLVRSHNEQRYFQGVTDCTGAGSQTCRGEAVTDWNCGRGAAGRCGAGTDRQFLSTLRGSNSLRAQVCYREHVVTLTVLLVQAFQVASVKIVTARRWLQSASNSAVPVSGLRHRRHRMQVVARGCEA